MSTNKQKLTLERPVNPLLEVALLIPGNLVASIINGLSLCARKWRKSSATERVPLDQ
jgi:hypothetical protein